MYWYILCGLAIGLCLLTLTPVVIPPGVFNPELFGLPYTLWMGIAITILLVVMTFLATRVYHHEEGEEQS